MINGLQVTISGEEAKQLCLKQAEFHAQKARTYKAQAETMAQVGVEMSHYSNDPKRAMFDKVAQHQNSASELMFIAEHLDLSETYRLDRSALITLGIARGTSWEA